jgi:hypothetical protein
MASFVHITDERLLRAILRGGIRPSKEGYGRYAPPGWPRRFVFCAPVLPTLEATFHWMREVAGPGTGRRGAAVQFRLADTEPVLVGVYGNSHLAMTAAEAVGMFLAAPWPRGMQVLVPRAIEPTEITRVRRVPRFIGWRRSAFRRGRPVGRPPSPAQLRLRSRTADRVLARLEADAPELWRRFAALGLTTDRAWRIALAEDLAMVDDDRWPQELQALADFADDLEAEHADLPGAAPED